jgi:NADPH2:quinone reductase
MRAAQISQLYGPDAVQVVDLPEPSAADGEVLVDVHAAGIAFPDLLMTRGIYQLKPTLPFVPGMEAAGVVRTAPPDAGVRPGDRVAFFNWVGGWAQVVAVPADTVLPLPASVDFATGSGLVLNPLTAHFALLRRGRLRPGETVLVHGAAGGVGTATLALARALGARTIAVVRDDGKAEVARRAGADEVVRAEGFLAAARELTAGRGVDVVVDPVGGDRFDDSVRVLAPEGRLLVVGFTGGTIPTVAVNRLLLRNVEVVGAAWGEFARLTPGFVQQQWTELVELVEQGRFRLEMGESYDLDRVADALRAVEARTATGKLSLRLR